MEIVFYLIWLVLVLYGIFSFRMMRFYFREAMYWHCQVGVTDHIIALLKQNPEFEPAMNHLLARVATENEAHRLYIDSLTRWERFKDGGRLPA